MENSSGVCCGLEVQIKDNQIVNVRPDKASMRSLGGYCCRKGRAMKYFQHNKTGVELSLMKPVDPLRLSIHQDFSYTAVTGPVAFNYEEEPEVFKINGRLAAVAHNLGQTAKLLEEIRSGVCRYDLIRLGA